MATATKKAQLQGVKTDPSGKKKPLGKWSIARVSESELTVKLPKGMVVTGKQVTVDDLLSAIATTNSLEKGRVVVKCCSGNMAIA